jgi:carboxyl-terminal processing protease
VPIDTTGVGPLFIKVSNQGLTFRFSARMADDYRPVLNKITNLKELNKFFSEVDFEQRFLQFASSNGVKATKQEWEESKELILNHIRAFVGRYTPLDDNAFYPILLEKDITVLTAIGL